LIAQFVDFRPKAKNINISPGEQITHDYRTAVKIFMIGYALELIAKLSQLVLEYIEDLKVPMYTLE
jgi:hypothetical protein